MAHLPTHQERSSGSKLLQTLAVDLGILSSLIAPTAWADEALPPDNGSRPAATDSLDQVASRLSNLNNLAQAAEALGDSAEIQRSKILPLLITYAASLESAKAPSIEELEQATSLLHHLCMNRYSQGFPEEEAGAFFNPVWKLSSSVIHHLDERRPSDPIEQRKIDFLLADIHDHVVFSGFHGSAVVKDGAADCYRANFFSSASRFTSNWPSRDFIGIVDTHKLQVWSRALREGKDQLAESFQLTLNGLSDLPPEKASNALYNLFYVKQGLITNILYPHTPFSKEERKELLAWYEDSIHTPFLNASGEIAIGIARVEAGKEQNLDIDESSRKEALKVLWWKECAPFLAHSEKLVEGLKKDLLRLEDDEASCAEYLKLLQGLPRTQQSNNAIASVLEDFLLTDSSVTMILDGVSPLAASFICEPNVLTENPSLADSLESSVARLKTLGQNNSDVEQANSKDPVSAALHEIFYVARNGTFSASSLSGIDSNPELSKNKRAILHRYRVAALGILNCLEVHSAESLAKGSEEGSAMELYYPSAPLVIKEYKERPAALKELKEAAEALEAKHFPELLERRVYGASEKELIDTVVSTMLLCERKTKYSPDQIGSYEAFLASFQKHFPSVTASESRERYSLEHGGVRHFPPVQIEGAFAPFESEYFYAKEAMYLARYGRSSLEADSPPDDEIRKAARLYAEAKQRHFVYLLSLNMIEILPEFQNRGGHFDRINGKALLASLHSMGLLRSNAELALEFENVVTSPLHEALIKKEEEARTDSLLNTEAITRFIARQPFASRK